MPKQHPRLSLVLLPLLAVALIVSCSDDTMDDATNVQPAQIETLLAQKVDKVPGLAEALQRLLDHLGGNPQPGVNIVPTADGFSGTVGVDTDGDGSQDANVAGSLTFNDPAIGISAGATLQLTELTGNVVQMSASLAVVGPGVIWFSNIVADVPVEGSRPRVTVSSGDMTVDASSSPPGLSGFANFTVGDLSASMTVSNDGAGNPTFSVQGDDFFFTMP